MSERLDILEQRINEIAQGLVEEETKQGINYKNSIRDREKIWKAISAQSKRIGELETAQTTIEAIYKTLATMGVIVMAVITAAGVLLLN